MNGLAPAAVFAQNQPLGGFRQVSPEELAWHTAEHFADERIEPGGIITTPDKRRYHHPLLLLIQRERREVARLRTDKSFISVLPARKGEEVILAPQRGRVSNHDREALAAASEYQARLRKIVAQRAAALRNPESEIRHPEVIPRAADALPGRDFFEPPMAQAVAEEIPESSHLPSLYNYEEPTVEEL